MKQKRMQLLDYQRALMRLHEEDTDLSELAERAIYKPFVLGENIDEIEDGRHR